MVVVVEGLGGKGKMRTQVEVGIVVRMEVLVFQAQFVMVL